MKKIVFFIVVLIAIFAISTLNDNSYNGNKVVEEKIDLDIESDTKNQNFGKSNVYTNNDLTQFNKQIPTKENIAFNTNSLKMNFSKNGARPPVSFEEINSLAKNDPVEATKAIDEIIKNPQSNFIELLALNDHCLGLLESQEILGDIFENQPFPKALWDTGYCSQFGTDSDPFLIHLELARHGHKLAQLTLVEEFDNALKREFINPRLYPIDYNDLRYEVLGYLKSLSTQEVALASLKLGKEFESNYGLFPQDLALSYFYYILYEKQAKGMVMEYPWECSLDAMYCNFKSPAELYLSLTEDEKTRAERMLKRIGY